MIWVSKAPGSNATYVAVFNTGNHSAAIPLDFALLGLKGKLTVRDLWTKMDLGLFKNKFSQKINAHGSLLLKVSVKAS